MPFDFVTLPGLTMQQQRAARGPHPIMVSGPALALSQMLPSLPGAPAAGGANALLWPCVVLYWLLLPVIHIGNDVPNGARMAEFLVHAQRLGVAFERLIVGGLRLEPCTPSVARARIKRLGIRLFMTDAAPFTAVFADFYPVEPTPPVGGVAQPMAVPPEAAEAEVSWFVSADGTFERLADAEPIIQYVATPHSLRAVYRGSF